MASQPNLVAAPKSSVKPAAPPAASAARVWPPLVLLALFWAIYAVWRWTELGSSLGFMGFLIVVGIEALTALLFTIWWIAASRVSWAERFLVIGFAIAGGIGAALLAHKMLAPLLVLPGVAIVLTTWTLGLVVVTTWAARRRVLCLISTECFSWAAFLLIRSEGMAGDGQLTLRWRWTPTQEELYLDSLEGKDKSADQPQATKGLKLQWGDWPEFRGPH